MLKCIFLLAGLSFAGYGTSLQSVPGTVVSSWIGNSFGGRPPVQNAHSDTTQYFSGSLVPDYVDAIWVNGADGAVFATSYYDEQGRNVFGVRNDSIIGSSFINKFIVPHNADIVGDNQFVYIVAYGNWGGGSLGGLGVERFDHQMGIAGWHNGGSDSGRSTSNSYWMIRDTGGATSISRLAIDTNAHELYFLDSATVHVFDLATLNQIEKTNFSLPNIQKMVTDHAGHIWVISGTSVKKYSNRGVYSGTAITTIKAPTCIAMNASGELFIFDDSTLQIHVFNNLSTTPTEEGGKLFGASGGIYGGTRGQVGPTKLEPRCSGIGTDLAGNLYFAWGDLAPVSGTDIRSVTPGGVQNWEILGQPFSSVPGFDPATDGQTVYFPNYTDSIDYSQSPGKEWRYRSFTWDRYANPSRPYGYIGSVNGFTKVRNLGGQKIVFTSSSAQTSTGYIIKKENQQVLVPVDSVSDPLTYAWDVDANGNIWWVDGKCYRKKYRGLDGSNNPIYNVVDSYTVPSTIGSTQCVHYDSLSDAIYLTGYDSTHTSYDPSLGQNEWGRAGKVIAKFSGFLRGTPTLAYKDTLPYDNSSGGWYGTSLKTVAIEGAYIFAVTCNSAPVELIYVFNSSDMSLVGVITPGDAIRGNISFTGTYGGLGWVDMVGGMQVYKRLNGEYEILVEDNVGNKVLFYRWCPSGACSSSPISPSQKHFGPMLIDPDGTVHFPGNISASNAFYYW